MSLLEDDQLDRRQVYGWQHLEPSRTNQTTGFAYMACIGPTRVGPGSRGTGDDRAVRTDPPPDLPALPT